MQTKREDATNKINCKLTQVEASFLSFMGRNKTKKYNAEWTLDKKTNLNYKVSATKYLQLHHTEWIGNTTLHFAANNRDVDAFHILLNSGADFTIQNNNNLTALHIIIEVIGISISEQCILDDIFIHSFLSAHLKCNNFENPSNNNGLSHFHIACAANNVEVVEGFLRSGVLIDHTVKTDCSLFPGFSPLHFAAKYCAFKVAEVLLLHGANVRIKDAKGMMPLHVALESKLKIISATHLDEALRDRNDKVLKLLLEKESNNEMIIDNWGLSHLHVACTLKDSKLAECLLQKVANINHTVNMNSVLWSGYTAMHFAALSNIDTVKLLMKKGADVNIKDSNGITSFEMCIEKYKTEDVYAILSSNPLLKNIMLSDGKTKLSDLVFAMRNSHQFNIFLRKLSKNFSIYDSPLWPGCTPMHVAVVFAKKLSEADKESTDEETNLWILNELFKQNSSMVHSQDVHGRTPLHLAFRLNKKLVLDLLMEFLNKEWLTLNDPIDEDGLSYLHIASAHNNIPLLTRMLSIGSDVNAAYKGKSLFSPEMYPGSTALHFAVSNGSVEAVETLMGLGADVYAKNSNDMTPIHLLLLNPKAHILLSTPNLKDCIVSGIGLSHLHIASYCDKPEIIEKLLDDGANINGIITRKLSGNERSSKLPFLEQYAGYSPLRIACQYRKYPPRTMELLLKRGADIFVENEKGKALLVSVFEEEYEYYLDEFVETQTKDDRLRARLKVNTGMTALHVACLERKHETIEKLLSEGADVNEQIHSDSPVWSGYTPLHILIHISQKYDIEKSIKILLEKGADVTLPNAKSKTAVHMAYERYDENTDEMYSYLNMMLGAQRDFSVNPASVCGTTHFHIACRVWNTSIVEEFLKYANIDINQATDYFRKSYAGYTALHLAAISLELTDAVTKQLDTLDLLLKHGANVHAEDAYGDTPLHECARTITDFDSLDLFERIARAGADVNARNFTGYTPLRYILESEDDVTLAGMKTLLRIGCRLNMFDTDTNHGYIGKAIRPLSYEEARKLFSTIIINFTESVEIDDVGRTAIHNTVSDDQLTFSASSYAALIEQLSRTGCDVDDQDKLGRTALHMAAKSHNFKAISGLLMAGADVNVSDKDGKTAFAHDFATCVLCERTSEVNDNKLKHFQTLETLAIHVKKLQLCGLDVNKQNEDLTFKTLEKLKSNALSEGFFNELEDIKNAKIKSHSLYVNGFLSETGAVADYPRMSLIKRKAVNKYFSPSEVGNFRGKFPELAEIIQLQYRKARARPPLVKLARNALLVLVGFKLPEICSDYILILLKNSDLKSLIASTIK